MDDKLIADYVRERYPEMLTTLDFMFYRIGHALRSFADGLYKAMNKEEQ